MRQTIQYEQKINQKNGELAASYLGMDLINFQNS